jgi:hypothetical protein
VEGASAEVNGCLEPRGTAVPPPPLDLRAELEDAQRHLTFIRRWWAEGTAFDADPIVAEVLHEALYEAIHRVIAAKKAVSTTVLNTKGDPNV